MTPGGPVRKGGPQRCCSRTGMPAHVAMAAALDLAGSPGRSRADLKLFCLSLLIQSGPQICGRGSVGAGCARARIMFLARSGCRSACASSPALLRHIM